MCLAADSGIDHARALGLVPDLVVGDFDSVTPSGLAWATEAGAVVDRHPTSKDRTDLELALDHALAVDPDRVVVIGIGGGRLDHQIANLALLAQRRFRAVAIEAMEGTARISIVHGRGERTIEGRPGSLVSLVPMHGPAEDVVTSGLRFPLRNETLPPGTSRGISNEMEGPTATVSLGAGTVLVVQPDALAPAAAGGAPR